jgi:hypothetical protein
VLALALALVLGALGVAVAMDGAVEVFVAGNGNAAMVKVSVTTAPFTSCSTSYL